MKKILSLKSIKNKRLRQRSDLSLLQKTTLHRYNNDSSDAFKEWLTMLSSKECKQVKDLLGYSNSYWTEVYNLAIGLSNEDSMWMDVLKIIKDESKNHCGLDYHIENATLDKLKEKFNISKK